MLSRQATALAALIADAEEPWGYVFETDIALTAPELKLPDLEAGEALDERFVYLGVCLVNAMVSTVPDPRSLA